MAESNRESITITVKDVNPSTVGLLIALFERTVGFYASFVNINAYHQPGVEAGKKAAGNVLKIQGEIIAFLKANLNKPFTVQEVSKSIGHEEDIETAFKILEHLAANPVRKVKKSGRAVFEARYKMV